MAITNYLASGKTRFPFCGVDCCGTKFGRAHIHHALRPQSSSPKRKMRRYARHADKRLVRREIQTELVDYYPGWGFEDIDPQTQYYADEFERSLLDDYDPLDGLYDDYSRPSFYDDYDDFDVDYTPHSYREVHPLFCEIQAAFHKGTISREKYYRLVDVLNSRD